MGGHRGALASGGAASAAGADAARPQSSDNLDLLQPVNPWTGNGWSAYDEEFLWNGMRNRNSRAISASAGDVMFARVYFNEKEQTYTASQANMNTGEIVNMTVPVEREWRRMGRWGACADGRARAQVTRVATTRSSSSCTL